jgi:LysM repeat protein
MRFQFYARSITIGVGLAVGLMLLSSGFDLRGVAAQPASTPTPRSTSAPIAGVPTTYTVQSGDSFNAIARRFNLTPQELQTLNGITNTSVIQVGQVLIVAVNTLTAEPTQTPAPTATSTTAPTHTPPPTSTSAPTLTPTSVPTSIPTSLPAVIDLPTAIPTFAPNVQPAPPSAGGIPADVIVVGIVMLLALIGLVVGFRTQRY